MDSALHGFRHGLGGIGLLARMLADRAFALGAVALCLAAATFLTRFLLVSF